MNLSLVNLSWGQALPGNLCSKFLAGDADMDADFDSSDLVFIFNAGKYENKLPNAFWFEGDFNGDRYADSSDLILAFSTGLYEKGKYCTNKYSATGYVTSPFMRFPVSQICMEMFVSGRSTGQRVYTNSSGSYRFTDLPVGTLFEVRPCAGTAVGVDPAYASGFIQFSDKNLRDLVLVTR